MSAYDELMAFQRQSAALSQVSGRLGWDQETMMPRGAADQRAEESAGMAAVLHDRRTDPRVGEWLSLIDEAGLDQVGRAQLRHIRRDYDRARRLPADLSAEIARVTSRAFGQWAEARAAEDVAAFLPVLDEILRLKRDEAAALAEDGDLYDALMQDYEPGGRSADFAAMFDALRPGLVELRGAVMEKDGPAPLSGTFDEQKQMKLARQLARDFGFDMGRGRMDKSVHPFSSGSGDDVRVTTRTSPDDPFNCFYSTIHEVGHGCYEQNINGEYGLSPLGRGVSMGVHESQSRIYENQLGRSRAFTGYLYARMREVFGDFGVADADAFYGTVNRVHKGYIRTEADEVQYNLHVMLRFDLEQAMVRGDLQVADLEAAWNDRFASDFGYGVDKPSNGCLQDVHWAAGLFGYFPTYSLGNVYAGCLNAALRDHVSGLDEAMGQGDLSPATNWLRDNVQVHGGLYEPREVITRACGREPDEAPLLAYLQEKFSEIYRL